MSKVDRIRARLRSVEAERKSYFEALNRISLLGMEDTAGDARMIALRAIGLRFASSVQVRQQGQPTVTVNAGGVYATCPDCTRSHKIADDPPSPEPAPGSPAPETA